jgi:hypothetical protein
MDRLHDSLVACNALVGADDYTPSAFEMAYFIVPFRSYFFCNRTTMCIMTLQLLVLSTGQVVLGHMDNGNGNHEVTSCFGLTGQTTFKYQGKSIVYSLKVLTNSRSSTRTSMLKEARLSPWVLGQCMNHLQVRVKQSYNEFITSHRDNGHQVIFRTQEDTLILTRPWNLFLDDGVKYQSIVVNDHLIQYCTLAPGIDRCVVMSNHAHVLSKVVKVMDRKDTASRNNTLLFHHLATYCGSPCFFTVAGIELFKKSNGLRRPNVVNK